MKIQLISDLHLEFMAEHEYKSVLNLFTPEPDVDVLVIAGDIGYIKHYKKNHEYWNALINYVSNNWDLVIIVPGNHDYYKLNSKMQPTEFSQRLDKLAENVFLINNDYFTIDNYDFICSTLWSNIPPQYSKLISRHIADYYYIKKFTIEKNNCLNNIARNFIIDHLEQTSNQCILCTHHLPSWSCVTDPYKTDMCTHAFANTEIDDWFITYEDKIPLWLHGHSHDAVEIELNKTLAVRNPIGYDYQRINYSNKVITL